MTNCGTANPVVCPRSAWMILQAHLDAGAEVVGAPRQIGLVQIIGAHPHHEQLVHQLLDDLGVVVDPFHAGRSGSRPGCRHSTSRSHAALASRRDLARMVEMRVEIDRMILLEHVAQLVGDPARQHAGEFRADADDLDVRDGAQAGDDVFQLLRR